MRNFHQKLMMVRVSHARCVVCTFVLLAGLATTAVAQRTPALDVLVLGGRVLDPETGLDAVRNIGIRGGRITVISAGALPAARDTINARGLVVSPGFIDLHSHGQDALITDFSPATASPPRSSSRWGRTPWRRGTPSVWENR